jgi:hypothetical protein
MEVSGQLDIPAALHQGKTPWYHSIGGSVGPGASVDTVGKRKSLTPEGNRTPISQSSNL